MTHSDEIVETDEVLSGDDLECIEAGGAHEWEPVEIARTALHHRQEAMDARDEVVRLAKALREAAQALDHAGFTHSSDVAYKASVIRLPNLSLFGRTETAR